MGDGRQRTVRPGLLRLGGDAEEESSRRLENEISVEGRQHFVDGSLLIKESGVVRRALVRIGRVGESDLLELGVGDGGDPFISNVGERFRLRGRRLPDGEQSSLVRQVASNVRNSGVFSLSGESLNVEISQQPLQNASNGPEDCRGR